jgi:hypothetical protein
MTTRWSAPLLVAALAGCGWQGPSLAGYPGLQLQVVNYYDAHALEGGALCPQPQMDSVVGARVVEDAPQRVVMAVRYHFRDEGQTTEGTAGSMGGCDGWGERTFTFARLGDGRLAVQEMTGPQREA